MQTPVGQPVTASLIDPGWLVNQGLRLGARIEVPVSRAIVAYWREAVLSGAVWTVTLDGVPVEVGAGDYNFVWRTDDPEPPTFEAFIPLTVTDPLIPSSSGGGDGGGVNDLVALSLFRDELIPEVDDVAQLERTRTYDDAGVDQKTFNESTTPTDEEVQKLIEQAVDDVIPMLPVFVSSELFPSITRAITLQTAILIEGSYFRDNVNTEAVTLYSNLFKDAMTALVNQGTLSDTSSPLRLT